MDDTGNSVPKKQRKKSKPYVRGSKHGNAKPIDLKKFRQYATLRIPISRIAVMLGVTERAIYRRIHSDDEFRQAWKEARAQSIEALRSTMYKEALGYSYNEEKRTITEDAEGATTVTTTVTQKFVKPNQNALNSCLKNFDPDWKLYNDGGDKQQDSEQSNNYGIRAKPNPKREVVVTYVMADHETIEKGLNVIEKSGDSDNHEITKSGDMDAVISDIESRDNSEGDNIDD